jgi:hypothetical protein
MLKNSDGEKLMETYKKLKFLESMHVQMDLFSKKIEGIV